jgi:hypothetical protein
VLHFPQCTIPAHEALIPGMMPTCAPILGVTERCKTCCSISALPLRLRCCVVLSVHKSQGIAVKKDYAFDTLIVNLSTEQTRTTPGFLDLVALSKPDSMHNLAIGNNISDLSHIMIMKIGTAPSYAKKKLFLNRIQQMHYKHNNKQGI